MKSIPIYILAGGRSSRFGSDKARAELNGESLLARLVKHVQSRASRITVVADIQDKYSDLDLRTITDEVAAAGPLGGLHAALRDLREDENWLLLLSCDLVDPPVTWIEDLLKHCQMECSAAAVFTDRWQPLVAVYHKQIVTEVEQRLAAGDRAMWRLLEASDAKPVQQLNSATDVFQVNSREELQALRSHLDV